VAQGGHRGRKVAIWVAAGLVVVLALGGFGYWWKFVRKDQSPVDVAEVKKQFDTGDRGGAARAGEPAPGVYLYDTEGTESVSALGGQTNTYPKTSTLTIVDTPCGVDARWDLLTGRYDLDALCRAANGTWSVTRTVVSDRFFNQTQVDTSTCTDLVVLPADPKPGTKTKGRCVNGDASTEYVYEVLSLGELTIGGKQVPTVHLRVTFTQGGSRSGGGTEERWVQQGTNLVVKARRTESDDSPSPVGRVTYKQSYSIELRSTTPQS
jgi:hypothetical protein